MLKFYPVHVYVLFGVVLVGLFGFPAVVALLVHALFPVFGFVVRLTPFAPMNFVVTVIYTVLYGIPEFILGRVWHYAGTWKNLPRVFKSSFMPEYVLPGSYRFDETTGIFMSNKIHDEYPEHFPGEYFSYVYDICSDRHRATPFDFGGSWSFSGGFQDLLKRLEDTFREEKGVTTFKILDIGTGTGTSMRDFASSFQSCELVGLDISVELLLKTQRWVPYAKYFQGTMEDTGFLSDTFHVISNTGGINETNFGVSLRESWRILKPGGLLIVSDENFDATSWWSKMSSAFFLNFMFLYFQSYLWNGTPVRKPKSSMQIFQEFSKSQKNLQVLSQGTIPGCLFYFILEKKKTA